MQKQAQSQQKTCSVELQANRVHRANTSSASLLAMLHGAAKGVGVASVLAGAGA